MRTADSARVGELENALRPRVERFVDWMPEPGRTVTCCVNRPGELVHDVVGIAACRHPRLGLLEEARALVCCPEDHRTAAEDPGSHGPLQGSWIGCEGHPRRNVGRHHPVLCDRYEQQVEEVELLLGRLAAREQQVE